MSDNKIAVVLFNLGGPDKIESVRPFLFNLFSDFFIIKLPYIFRIILAFFISVSRNKEASENYKILGGCSPLLNETQMQKQALERKLKTNINNIEFKVFISMRYWHPFSLETIKEIKDFDPNEILCLPLYPHFSTTTTKSSFYDFCKSLRKLKYNVMTKFLCCYFNQVDFIDSHVSLIIDKLREIKNFKEKYVIIFSAHSLPLKIINDGDPYQWQIEESVNLIIQQLKNKSWNIDYEISYQSKIGPVKWLEPSTEKVIKKYVEKKHNMILVPISFVSEHIEVLVELDIEYKKIANEKNVKFFRITTLRLDDNFINSLYKNILTLLENNTSSVVSSNIRKNCPTKCRSCLYGKFL